MQVLDDIVTNFLRGGVVLREVQEWLRLLDIPAPFKYAMLRDVIAPLPSAFLLDSDHVELQRWNDQVC